MYQQVWNQPIEVRSYSLVCFWDADPVFIVLLIESVHEHVWVYIIIKKKYKSMHIYPLNRIRNKRFTSAYFELNNRDSWVWVFRLKYLIVISFKTTNFYLIRSDIQSDGISWRIESCSIPFVKIPHLNNRPIKFSIHSKLHCQQHVTLYTCSPILALILLK
jgi:hypothetical protein